MTAFIVPVVVAFLLLAMLLTLISTVRTRRLLDQVLAINLFGTLAVALIAAISLLLQSDYFIDIALLYALVNFIAAIAILRLFNKRSLVWPAFRGASRDASRH